MSDHLCEIGPAMAASLSAGPCSRCGHRGRGVTFNARSGLGRLCVMECWPKFVRLVNASLGHPSAQPRALRASDTPLWIVFENELFLAACFEREDAEAIRMRRQAFSDQHGRGWSLVVRQYVPVPEQ